MSELPIGKGFTKQPDDFIRVAALKELQAAGMIVVPGAHCPIRLPSGKTPLGNPKTGRTIVVRVNDRGPFTSGLTLDLSSGAARAIGMRSTQSVTMRHC